MYHFKLALLELISLYNNKGVYQEKKLSTSRAIEYYIKRNDIINLINQKDFEIIKKEYKEYLDKNKIPLSNNNYERDEDENYEIYKNIDIISDSDNSDNSDDYMDDIKKNNHDNDSDDDDPNNNGNPKKYLISKT